jgi:hypothetical protein
MAKGSPVIRCLEEIVFRRKRNRDENQRFAVDVRPPRKSRRADPRANVKAMHEGPPTANLVNLPANQALTRTIHDPETVLRRAPDC